MGISPDARANLSPPASHLEAVPDLPTPLNRTGRGQGSLQAVPDGPGAMRPWVVGPFLSLLGPQPEAIPAAAADPAVADGLQLHWDGIDGRSLRLVSPSQQHEPAPGDWVLRVPLEPLLLRASAQGVLQDLVIDWPEALVPGETTQHLADTYAALVAATEAGPTGQWLQLEEQLLAQLASFLHRPDLAGAHRRDRGWRHLCLSLSWMAEHLTEDFNLAEVAVVAGITPRALQMAYRKHLNKRPLQSLRLLRLAELRRLLLQSANPSRRLMEHLDRCGLSRSGSTARHYRERYGEKPSQTRR